MRVTTRPPVAGPATHQGVTAGSSTLETPKARACVQVYSDVHQRPPVYCDRRPDLHEDAVPWARLFVIAQRHSGDFPHQAAFHEFGKALALGRAFGARLCPVAGAWAIHGDEDPAGALAWAPIPEPEFPGQTGFSLWRDCYFGPGRRIPAWSCEMPGHELMCQEFPGVLVACLSELAQECPPVQFVWAPRLHRHEGGN